MITRDHTSYEVGHRGKEASPSHQKWLDRGATGWPQTRSPDAGNWCVGAQTHMFQPGVSVYRVTRTHVLKFGAFMWNSTLSLTIIPW